MVFPEFKSILELPNIDYVSIQKENNLMRFEYIKKRDEAKKNMLMWRKATEEWNDKIIELDKQLSEKSSAETKEIEKEKTARNEILLRHEENRKKGKVTKITLKEAKILDSLFFPQFDFCPHCGNKNPYQITISGDEPFFMNLPCDCEKSVKLRQEKEEAEELEKQKTIKYIQELKCKTWLQNSGIEGEDFYKTFDNYHPKTPTQKICLSESVRFVDRCLNSNSECKKGLYLSGVSGNGKTHLATAVAISLINSGIRTICKSAIDLFGDLKRCFDDKNANFEEVLNNFKTVPVLIIDDIDKVNPTDWVVEKLFEIIDKRSKNKRQIFITSNCNLRELENRLIPRNGDSKNAEAIVSRLYGACFAVEVYGEDMRRVQ